MYIYKVEVTNVTLKDGHRILSRKTQINIFLGDIRSLTCTTDISRPVATIVWYIGSAVKQRSTSTTFIYTAAYEDNNSRIYCKAFNTQSESEAVASGDPMLYVKGIVLNYSLITESFKIKLEYLLSI